MQISRRRPLERGIESKRDDAGAIARVHRGRHRIHAREGRGLCLSGQAAGPIDREHDRLGRVAERQPESCRAERRQRDDYRPADECGTPSLMRRPEPPLDEQQHERDEQQRLRQVVSERGSFYV